MRALLGVICLFISHVGYAQVSDIAQKGHTLTFNGSKYPVSITMHKSGVFEVVYHIEDNMIASFALPQSARQNNQHDLPSLIDESEYYRFGDTSFSVRVHRDTGRLSFHRSNALLVAEEAGAFVYPNMRGFRFGIDPGEAFYGGGQRVLGMDRRGHKMPLYNRAHYGYTTESNQMYYGLPAVMSNQDYAILFDNSATGELDIGADDADVLEFTAVAGRMAYIVVMAENTAQLSQRVTQTTGLQPTPARWTLGNFASRFGYRSQSETLATAAKFRDLDVPLDAIVLDLYWFGPDVKGHMGNLQWDKDAWPTPRKMISELRKDNIKTVVITEPFILTTSKQWESAVTAEALANGLDGQPKRFDFFFGNTGLVDVFKPQATAWFDRFYEDLFADGVAGWWGDLGEPEVHPSDALHQLNGITRTADELHNVYGHQWASNVFAMSQRVRPNERPFIMMRSGFLGSQRFGMVPWTGDVSRSWGGLKPQVELALQMSVFGLAYIHSDVGGFAGGEEFDPELYIRWVQHSAFSPVFRPHAQENIAPEPVFHPDPALEIARDFIQLRYQLMPYIYSMALENSMSGMPLMRPLSFYHAELFADNAQSYYFGDAFLVTPVTSQGTTEMDVDLPKGVWFDYWNKTAHEGNQVRSVLTPLKHMPIHVKAGSFIPMLNKAPMHLDDYNTQNVTIEYYAHADITSADGIWYEDDGTTVDSLSRGEYQTIIMDAQQTDKALFLVYGTAGDYPKAPDWRNVTQVIHGLPYPRKVIVDGVALNTTDWTYSEQTLEFNFTLNTEAKISVYW